MDKEINHSDLANVQNPSRNYTYPENDSKRYVLISIIILLISFIVAGFYVFSIRSKVILEPTPTPAPSRIAYPKPSITDTNPADIVENLESAAKEDYQALNNLENNWKLYSSKDNSYTFKFPPTWTDFTNQSPLGVDFVNVACDQCTSEDTIDLFAVTPVVYKSIEEYQNNNKIIRDSRRITFNNLSAVKSVVPGGPQAGGSSIEIFFVYKNQGYSIGMRFPGLIDKNKLSDFPEASPDILSTFQLLNP